MAEKTTTKRINLYQLSQQIGGSPSLRMRGTGDSTDPKTITSSSTQAALDAAIAAHTADFNVIAPAGPAVVNQAAVVAAIGQAIIDMDAVVTRMNALVASAAVPAGAALTTTQLTTVVRALDSAARTTAADVASMALRLKQLARLLNGDFSSST